MSKAKKKTKKSGKKTSKKTAKSKFPKAVKCCKNCQDYKKCDDKGKCCEYCDHYSKGFCTYELTKKLVDNIVELTDYRGDDFGIDDYEQYESEYQ